MKYLVFILFAILVFFHRKAPHSHDQIIGVKIYDHSGDFGHLITEWNSIGINTAFVSKELLANKEFRKQTEKARIKTFVILPVFFDENLDDHPNNYAIKSNGEKAIEEWVKFACPSNVQYRKEKINAIVNLVESYNPDGISIDFIRHFVFWEKVYPDALASALPNTCFCNSCIHQFCSRNKINKPDSLSETSDISSWILDVFPDQWTSWKCQLITTMIYEIVSKVKKVKPEVLVNVHVVPWEKDAFKHGIQRIAGQDLKAMSPLTDYLSPMTYSHMVKQNAGWVHEVVTDFEAQTIAKVLPSIQVKEAYLSDTIGSRIFEDNLRSALLPPSSGVIFWSWEHLEKDPWKKDIIKEFAN